MKEDMGQVIPFANPSDKPNLLDIYLAILSDAQGRINAVGANDRDTSNVLIGVLTGAVVTLYSFNEQFWGYRFQQAIEAIEKDWFWYEDIVEQLCIDLRSNNRPQLTQIPVCVTA